MEAGTSVGVRMQVRHVGNYCAVKFDSRRSLSGDRKEEEDAADAAADRVWDILAELGTLIEGEDCSVALQTDTTKGGQAGKGRCFECLRKMICAWEQVRVARTYLSPRSLRAFTAMTIHLAPLFLAPYWHSFCGSSRFSSRSFGSPALPRQCV